MKKIFFTAILILSTQYIFAQAKLMTKTGSISFHSKASLENIDAKNNKVLSVFSPADGKIEFSVLMKGFEFEKALMQEHFNDDYVESDKFPKATFKGIIENPKQISLSEDHQYNVKVSGTLMMHGVSKQVSAPATITIKGGIVSASANFSVLLSDYNIKIPAVVKENISNLIAISVNVPAYQPM